MINPRKAFERIYRMDEMACFDWTQLCGSLRCPGQGPPPKASVPVETKAQRQSSRMRIEYLQAVTELKRWYQITVPVAEMDADGMPIERQEKWFFQLLNVAFGRTRPKLMPTIESHSMPVNIEKLAFCIQEASVRREEHPGGNVHVVIYADADPRWVKWSDLAPWERLYRSLTHYGSVEGAPDADDAGCLVLRNPEPVRCTLPLTDDKCPTLCILIELRRRGWRSTVARVVHTGVEVGEYDSPEPGKMKLYFIALLDIERVMPIGAPRIPSDQPLSYYRLLLNGQSVLPALGDKHHQSVLKGVAAKAPMPIADDSDSSSDYRRPPHPVAKGAIAWFPLGPDEETEEGDPSDPRGLHRAADTEIAAKTAKAKAPPKAKSSSSGAKAKAPPQKPPPAPKAAPPLPPRSPSSSESGRIPAKGVGAIAIAPPPPKAKAAAAADEADRVGAIDAIGGGKALYKEYMDPHTAKMYCNWRFYCPHKGLPGHPPGCMRTLGVIPKHTSLGVLEPIAFLHVWRDTPADLAKGHRKTPPPKAAVKAFLEEHRAKLQRMQDHFLTP